MTRRRIVSSRVTGRRVVGSANPVARWGRGAKSTCFDSIGGFFFGLLLFIIPFLLTYCAAKTEKDSKDIAGLEVVAAEQAQTLNGPALVQGTVVAGSEIVPEYSDGLTSPILFYEYELSREVTRIEQKKRTETRIENGQEVEYEITDDVAVTDWETEQRSSEWARVMLGSIKIDPKRCSKFDLPRVETFSDSYTDVETGEPIRETQTVIYANTNAILAAEFENGQIAAQPDYCILTTASKEELIAQLNLEEEAQRWGLIILSVIVMTISFNLMLGPAMLIINIIPVRQLSCAVRAVLTLVSLIVSIMLVSITYVIVRYWWLIALALIGLAVWVVIEANKNREANPVLDLEDDEENTEPEAT